MFLDSKLNLEKLCARYNFSCTQQFSGPLVLRLDPALRELNRFQTRGRKKLYWRHCGTVRSELQAEVAFNDWAREFKPHFESQQLVLDWSHPDFQGDILWSMLCLSGIIQLLAN